MGYTHYFNFVDNFEPSKKQVAEAVTLVNALLSNLPQYSNSAGGHFTGELLIVQLGEDDISPPIVDKNVIIFNGVGELAHENFCLELSKRPDHGIEFCKTARKPYDLAVISTLTILKYVFGDGLSIHSDGDANDWESALPTVIISLSAAGILPDDFPNLLTFNLDAQLRLSTRPLGKETDTAIFKARAELSSAAMISARAALNAHYAAALSAIDAILTAADEINSSTSKNSDLNDFSVARARASDSFDDAFAGVRDCGKQVFDEADSLFIHLEMLTKRHCGQRKHTINA
jgi:hypothetical protein